MSNKKGFVSLISMLITLAIICYLAYYLLNIYFKPSTGTPQAGGSFSGSNPSVSGYKSMAESTKDKVTEINRLSQERMDQLGDTVK